jgi:hypothetical protein
MPARRAYVRCNALSGSGRLLRLSNDLLFNPDLESMVEDVLAAFPPGERARE